MAFKTAESWYTDREAYTSSRDKGYTTHNVHDIARFEDEELALDQELSSFEYCAEAAVLPQSLACPPMSLLAAGPLSAQRLPAEMQGVQVQGFPEPRDGMQGAAATLSGSSKTFSGADWQQVRRSNRAGAGVRGSEQRDAKANGANGAGRAAAYAHAMSGASASKPDMDGAAQQTLTVADVMHASSSHNGAREAHSNGARDSDSEEYDHRSSQYSDANEPYESSDEDARKDMAGVGASPAIEHLDFSPNMPVLNLRVYHDGLKLGMTDVRQLAIQAGDIMGDYKVTCQIGDGTSARVFDALDLRNDRRVCLKVVENDKDYFDQGLNEAKLLHYVNSRDPRNRAHVLRLFDFFYFREHLVLVTELLDHNLYDWSEHVRDSPSLPTYFTLPRVQAIARQVLTACAHLHEHGVIHHDIKPENVAFSSIERAEVRLIDFGAARHDSDSLSSYVQSRSYRAPEVMLGLPHDCKVDVWSVGAVLAELLTGRVLFENHSTASLLARLESMLGPVPHHLLSAGKYSQHYYTRSRKLFEYHSPEDKGGSPRYTVLRPKHTTLAEQVPEADSWCIDFLLMLLTVDPDTRPTAAEALEHPWLSVEYPVDAHADN